MKGLNLTPYQLTHNSGADLWDYLFENQPLKYIGDDDLDSDGPDWYDEGITWLTDELLDGEIFQVFEDADGFAFTSMGRHVNLKKKTYRKLTLQGNTIAGNMNHGAFSMSKLVKATWNIDLDYKTLPYECTQHITTSNASQGLRKWIKENE